MSARIIKISLLSLLFLLPALSYASVSINEVFYSPQSRSWVEVYNDSDATVDLSKYKILDSGAAINGHSISSISGGSLGPHGYAVIAKDPTTVSAATLYKASLGAKTSGDTISIKDDSGNIADTFTFTSDMGAAGDGNSLQKTSSGGWIAAAPTPGAGNSSIPAPTSAGDDASASDTGSSATSDSGGSGSTKTVVTILSTHYSYLPLSAFDERANLSAGAGRTRLGSVGSPMAFKAEVNDNAGAQFTWNFGDGSLGSGERIDHTYRYPGDYVVVLNVSNGVDQAVARTQVKIVEPELSISQATPAVIELSNSSQYEVNLYGWKLASAGKTFEFPQDTIILPGQKIDFDQSVTGLAPISLNAVALENSLSSSEVPARTIDPQKIALLQSRANVIQTELDTLVDTQVIPTHAEPSSIVANPEEAVYQESITATPLLAVQEMLSSSTASTTASTTKAHKPSTAYGWFTKIKHFFGFK